MVPNLPQSLKGEWGFETRPPLFAQKLSPPASAHTDFRARFSLYLACSPPSLEHHWDYCYASWWPWSKTVIQSARLVLGLQCDLLRQLLGQISARPIYPHCVGVSCPRRSQRKCTYSLRKKAYEQLCSHRFWTENLRGGGREQIASSSEHCS